MAFFSVFGLFAIWGTAIWLGILIVLLIADAIWTHGLATSWLHGTGIVLQQIWSFFSLLVNIVQRLVAMAPRGLQIFLFLLLGAVALSLVMNWFVAADVVCVDKTAYTASLPIAWFAKSLDPVQGGDYLVAISCLSPEAKTIAVETSGSCSGVDYRYGCTELMGSWDVCERTGCNVTTNGWFGSRMCEGLQTPCASYKDKLSCTYSLCTWTDVNGKEWKNNFTFVPGTGFVASVQCYNKSTNTQAKMQNLDTGILGTAVNVPTAGYVENATYLINKAQMVSRKSFYEASKSSFKEVNNFKSDGYSYNALTYSCGVDDEVQIGLYGAENVFSVEIMAALIIGGSVIWVLFKLLG